MDEEAENVFDLFLMVDEISCLRLLMRPHSHPHDEPFGKLEDILVCFVIADEKQTGLPEMVHEGQGGRSFPVLPGGNTFTDAFPKIRRGIGVS